MSSSQPQNSKLTSKNFNEGDRREARCETSECEQAATASTQISRSSKSRSHKKLKKEKKATKDPKSLVSSSSNSHKVNKSPQTAEHSIPAKKPQFSIEAVPTEFFCRWHKVLTTHANICDEDLKKANGRWEPETFLTETEKLLERKNNKIRTLRNQLVKTGCYGIRGQTLTKGSTLRVFEGVNWEFKTATSAQFARIFNYLLIEKAVINTVAGLNGRRGSQMNVLFGVRESDCGPVIEGLFPYIVHDADDEKYDGYKCSADFVTRQVEWYVKNYVSPRPPASSVEIFAAPVIDGGRDGIDSGYFVIALEVRAHNGTYGVRIDDKAKVFMRRSASTPVDAILNLRDPNAVNDYARRSAIARDYNPLTTLVPSAYGVRDFRELAAKKEVFLKNVKKIRDERERQQAANEAAKYEREKRRKDRQLREHEDRNLNRDKKRNMPKK